MCIHANWARKDQAEDKGHNKMQITNTKLGLFLHSKFRLRSHVLESLHNSLNQILVSFISGWNIFHNLLHRNMNRAVRGLNVFIFLTRDVFEQWCKNFFIMSKEPLSFQKKSNSYYHLFSIFPSKSYHNTWLDSCLDEKKGKYILYTIE